MEQHAREQDEIRLYLLGLLPQERRPPLEERLLTDEDLYEELLIAEDELIDQYLAGELAARDRQGFESHFMNAPERRRQLRFAAALRRYVKDEGAAHAHAAAEASAEPERGVGSAEYDRRVETEMRRGSLLSWLRARNPVIAFSAAAAALLLVLGVSWVAMRGLRPRAPRQVFAVVLTPDVHTRGVGGDVQQVTVPVGTDALRLQLRLAPDDFQSYDAALLDADGATVSSADGLAPEQADGTRVVNVSVPAQSAPPGEYQLRLVGVYADGRKETADNYRLRIAAR